MNRKIILIAVAVAMMLALSTVPALAKPYTITVVVKDSAKKPVENLQAHVVVKTGDPAQDSRMPSTGESLTDARGNVEFAWEYDELCPYSSYTLWLNGTEYGTFDLNKKQGGRTQIVYYDLGISIVVTGDDYALVGDWVNYTFTVTNTGSFPLSTVTVNGSITGTATGPTGDDSNPGVLDLTETWSFTDSWQVPESPASLANIATVEGYYGAIKVTAEDTHTLTVATPGINVAAAASLKLAQVDATVTYTFTVTNTGDVPLSTISVTGSETGAAGYQSGDADSDTLLDVSETWIFTSAQSFGATGIVVNTATATGYFNSAPYTDNDAHSLEVIEQGPAPVTLTSPNSENYGYFGDAIAVGGGYIFVGATGETSDPGSGVLNDGRVYVYDETTYAFATTLTSPNPEEWGWFGWPMAISGDYLFVGAVSESNGAESSGNVYCYSLSNLSDPPMMFTSPNPQNYGYFGYSIRADATHVAIGAPNENSWTGRVYVFELDGTPVTTLTGQPASDKFGNKLLMHDANLYVGQGAVCVYDASTFAFGTTITSPGQENGYFGDAIAAFDDTFFIGAYLEDPAGQPEDAGRLYVFDHDNISDSYDWVLTLNSPNPTYNGYFGSEVQTDGTHVIIGASGEGEIQESGKVYVYPVSDLSATPVILSTPNPSAYGYFGNEIHISGEKVFVGGSGETHGGYQFAGNVYIYDLTP